MSGKNALLVKAEVGRAKPSTYSLPAEDFAFGKAYVKDKEGAKEVSMSWQFHQNTRDPVPIVDFKQKNKQKLAKNPVSASNKQETPAKALKKTLIPDETFTYGKKVKPSTPMGKVLANEFVEEAEKALKKAAEKPKIASKSKQIKADLQKAGQKAADRTREKGKQGTFVLKKFQNVEPRVNTNKEAAKEAELKVVERYFAENK